MVSIIFGDIALLKSEHQKKLSVMKETTTNKTEQGVVKTLRLIRDEVSNEIKDMTYLEERAYLDNLLSRNTVKKPSMVVAKK